MGKYASISVPIEVKQHLKLIKGDRTWGEFLSDASNECRVLRGEEAFEELRRLLSDEDLEAIRESSKDFRKNFVLR
jgi:hypothetical protein